MTDCDRQCYIIGGPWITYDPSCPVHGDEARKAEATAIANTELLDEALKEIDRLTLALHKHRAHPDFEYCTTDNARKGETRRPEGEGWEENICERNEDGTLNQHSWWERFDYHEDNYWRRRTVQPSLNTK
jgi:hypothetical protein